MQTTISPAAYRKAPGQRGGPEWRGPRLQLVTRVDPTSAALLKIRAKASGMTVSEFLEGLVARAVASTTPGGGGVDEAAASPARPQQT